MATKFGVPLNPKSWTPEDKQRLDRISKQELAALFPCGKTGRADAPFARLEHSTNLTIRLSAS